MDVERLNEQQEAEPTAELTQEQREAVDKAVKAIAGLTIAIRETLVHAIRKAWKVLKGITEKTRARLQHQAKIQRLKKSRKKHRTPQQKKWGKYYLIKTAVKEAKAINIRKTKQKPKSSL